MKQVLALLVILLIIPSMVLAHGDETNEEDEKEQKGLSLEQILLITLGLAIIFALFINWIADIPKKSVIAYMIGAAVVFLLLDYIYMKYILYA